MGLKLKDSLLGLGSIVTIESENHEGLYVILARGAMKVNNSEEVIPRYLVGPHPYGEAPDQETFPILNSEISKIIFEGYFDDNDEQFIKDLLHQMEYGKKPTQAAKQYKESLTEISEVESINTDFSDYVMKKHDPFINLRNLNEKG